jgi:hypothetical protein
VVTSVNAGALLIPGFRTLATATTRGNDTLVITLPVAGGGCVAAYKLVQGNLLTLTGPPPPPPLVANTTATAAPAAAKAAASSAARAAHLAAITPTLAAAVLALMAL